MDKNERITGGNKRKIQKRRAWGGQAFTEAKRQAFLDTLANCANVTRSARAAGATRGWEVSGS